MTSENPQYPEKNESEKATQSPETDSKTDSEKEIQEIIDDWVWVSAKLGLLDTPRTLASEGLVSFPTREEAQEYFRKRKEHLLEDVYRWLARTSRNTLVRGGQAQEAENPYARRDGEDGDAYRARLIKDLHIVHDNPLAEIDPSRRWVPWTRWQDEKGYRLSDRL